MILILPHPSDMKVWFFKRERHGFFFFFFEKNKFEIGKGIFREDFEKRSMFSKDEKFHGFRKVYF